MKPGPAGPGPWWRGGTITRPRARWRFAVLAFALALLPANARAHDQPFSFLDLRLRENALEGRVMAHVQDLAGGMGVGPPESLLAAPALARRIPALARLLAERLDVRCDGRRLVPHFDAVAQVVSDRKLVAIGFRAEVARPVRIEIAGPLFPEDPQHETYVNVYEGDSLSHQDLLDSGRRRLEIFTHAGSRPWAVLRTFVAQGIHHIFIGPDHILFVVGLLLLGGGLARLLKIVTAFTLAHSITLALATLHVLNPPHRVIEPAIALSIVAVGVENLLASRHARDWRTLLAFGFGFLHGFGFASVLAEFGLPRGALGVSLFSFNLGVEIGQACIVLTVAPALAWTARRSPRAGRLVAGWGSAGVIAAGTYWLVERLRAG